MNRERGVQRGYTAVELMLAIGIFGIGVAGMISMQKVTSVSNQHAKNLSIATHIAESWLDMLATDAVAWNQPSPNAGAVPDIGTDTVWLQQVKANADTANDWFLPQYSSTLNFGPAFDALGNPLNPAAGGNIAFCSHLRLSWLYQPNASGNGLIRAEVRVFWLRDGQGFAQPSCTSGQVTNVGGAVQTFHFVQKVSAIRENGQ